MEIASLSYAAHKCSDIAALEPLKTLFKEKIGTDFVDTSIAFRPGCQVHEEVKIVLIFCFHI